MYLDESSGSKDFGSSPTIFQNLDKFKASKFFKQIKYAYYLYTDNFGVRGRYFFIKAAVMECSELVSFNVFL